jgi:hypothetical protein
LLGSSSYLFDDSPKAGVSPMFADFFFESTAEKFGVYEGMF